MRGALFEGPCPLLLVIDVSYETRNLGTRLESSIEQGAHHGVRPVELDVVRVVLFAFQDSIAVRIPFFERIVQRV